MQSINRVVRLNRDATIRQICFNDNDRTPFWLGSEEMAEFYEAYGHFYRLANDPARQLQLKLTPGTVVVLTTGVSCTDVNPFPAAECSAGLTTTAKILRVF